MGLDHRNTENEENLIPAEWEVKTFRDIGECLIGLTYKPSDVKEGGTLVLRASNIENGRLVFEDNVYVDMEIPKRLLVREDDLLICVRNGSRDLIGKCALLSEDNETMTFGAFMSVFRTRNAPYVFCQFQSIQIQQQIRKNLGATINQITNKSLYSFEILVPKKESEQRAIAEVLGDVDALIVALDRLIAKKRAIKQGAMQQLLTGNTRLPGFSGDWDVRKLGDIGELKKGRYISKNLLSPKGEPCILYGEIYTKYDYIVRELSSCIPKVIAEKSTSIKAGDILFAGSGETVEDIGKCVAYLGSSTAYAGGDLIILSPLGADSTYLGYQLNSLQINKQKEKLGQGSSVVHIYASGLTAMEVPFPSIDEQQAIGALLYEIDSEIAALETQREKTRAIKLGLMQELLTGKTRLL